MPLDTSPYDALLLVSFGGPEKPEDVVPFLENVTRGRGIPRERLEEVGEHYFAFGGRSPINDQNRAFIAAVEEDFRSTGIDLPVYWGNRNWDPFLADTLRQMRDDRPGPGGIGRGRDARCQRQHQTAEQHDSPATAAVTHHGVASLNRISAPCPGADGGGRRAHWICART